MAIPVVQSRLFSHGPIKSTDRRPGR